MRTKDQCLDEAAKKIMLDWNLSGFKTSFPKLYESFMEAMEAYRSQPSGAKSPQQYFEDQFGKQTGVVNGDKMISALTAQAQDHAQEMEAFAQFSQDTIKELFRLMIEAAPDRTLSEIVLTISPTSEFLEAFRSSRTGEGKEGVSKSTYSEYPNCSCRTDFVCPIHFKGDQ